MKMNEFFTSTFINYLKETNPKLLEEFYTALNKNEEKAQYYLRAGYNTMHMQRREYFVTQAKKCLGFNIPLSDPKFENFYMKQIGELQLLLTDILTNKNMIQKEKSINEMYKDLLKNMKFANWKLTKKFSQKWKIPTLRFYLININLLIEQRNLATLKLFVEKKNKKGKLVPFEAIGALLEHENLHSESEQYLVKIKDIDLQLQLLNIFGFEEKACEVAIKNKKSQFLEEIQKLTKNEEINEQINEYFYFNKDPK